MQRLRKALRCLFRFRNAQHEVWFYLSLGNLLIYLLLRLTSKERVYFLPMAGLYFLTSAIAVYVVLIRKEASESFSSDCIWFNGLAGAILLLYYFL